MNDYNRLPRDERFSNVHPLNISEGRSRTQHRAKRQTAKVSQVTVTGILLLVFIVSGYCSLPFDMVKKVEVEGNHFTNRQQLLSVLDVHPFDNRRQIMSKEQGLNERLQENIPLIDSISLSVQDTSNLKVKVRENPIVGKVSTQTGYQLLTSSDRQAILLSEEESQKILANHSYDEFPDLVNFKLDNERDLLVRSFEHIDPALIAQMESIELQEYDRRVIIPLKDGNEIHALLSTISDKISYYPQIAESLAGQIGIIHLEVGAYFEPYE